MSQVSNHRKATIGDKIVEGNYIERTKESTLSVIIENASI